MYSGNWSSVREELRRGVDPAVLADMGYPVESDGKLLPVDPAQTAVIVSLLREHPEAAQDTWQIDPSTRAVGLQAIQKIRQQLPGRIAS